MKKILIFLIIIFNGCTFAQISGTSKPGKLTFKKEATKVESKKIDNKAPFISLIQPKIKDGDSITVRDEEFEIKLKASDSSGIKSVIINENSSDELQPNLYSYKTDLDKGLNELVIVASDNNDNNSFYKIFVTYKPDKTGPSIQILEPKLENNQVVIKNRNKISVKAKIYDESGISEIALNDNNPTLVNNDIYSFNLELSEGDNSVELITEDKKGNSSDLEFNIVYKIDATSSNITLLEPVLNENNEIRLIEKSIAVRGSVEDADEVSEVTVNNNRATFINENEFYSNVFLKDGTNNITIKIKDKSGNVNEKKFSVIQLGDMAGPIIKILEPYTTRGTQTIHKNEVINIKGVAIDESGVFDVTVNNRKANLLPNGEFTIDMFLDVGNNRITVKARDYKMNTSFDTLFIERKVEELLTRGKYYALIIGINKYRGSWPELNNAVNDAKAVADVLKNEYLFDQVTTLYDEEATRKNIIQKIEWLEDNAKGDDNVLIFYSGHGEFKQNQNRGYWVPVDATTTSTADFISNPDIQTHLNGISSKHTLLIADACFSGDIFKGRTETMTFENSDRYFKEVYRKASRTALTSGGIEPVTDGGREGHSVFTYYLLKTLKGYNSKYLTSGQLFDEIKIPVTNNSEQRPNYQPIKNTGDEGGEFIFIRK